MKKYLIIIIFAITIIIIAVRYSNNQATINELNISSDSNNIENQSYIPPISQNALPNLKASVPYKGSNFSVTWNIQSNQADVTLYQPYPDSAAAFTTWLADYNVSNLPFGIINIIKK